jgi:hypothetical protein
MATAGRKPLGTGHVDQLSGSERAKLRLETILDTLRGELKIAEACRQLGVCESRFFAMRNHWLQESLELLEPRLAGRPPKRPVDPRQVKLEQANLQLRQQLVEAEVRRDVDQILVSAPAETNVSESQSTDSKKKMPAAREGAVRRGESRRRPR